MGYLLIWYMRPFHSKLNPHYEFIRTLRKRRKTWREIVEELAGLGMKTCPSAVYEYYKRHSRRPYPFGWEDEPTPTAKPRRSAHAVIGAIQVEKGPPKRFSYDPQADQDLLH